MKDADCVRFLQWALPQLHMRWPGFRKVRGQVCKRITQRLQQLQLHDVDSYQHYLSQVQHEWQILDNLCQVTIARFYRDKLVFSQLSQRVLPELAAKVQKSAMNSLYCWSIGCASGEEPYTLALIWHWRLAKQYPDLHLSVLATDVDAHMLERSRQACYPYSTIKNLPADMRTAAFLLQSESYCLQEKYKATVKFQQQDIRETLPEQQFHLILCRNLVFTYFDEDLQRTILYELVKRLLPFGWLVLGVHEKLPGNGHALIPISEKLGLYQKLTQ